MTLVRKCKFHFKYFYKHFRATKPGVKYTVYFMVFFFFFMGLGLPLIPKMMAKRESQKLADKIEEHSSKKAVSATAVEVGDLKKTFTIFSSLKGKHEVVMYTDSKVTISGVLVQPGTYVKKDQVLVLLDSSTLKIKKRLADIDFQLKEAEFQVTKNLADKEFVSRNEMNQKSLEFEAEKLRQELNRSESTNSLKAPIAGLVTEVKFHTGDYIDDPSKYYIKIVDQTSYRIETYLPYEVAQQLKIGGQVEINNIQNADNSDQKVRAPASVSKMYNGTIYRISPGIDQSTGTVSVDIEANLPAKDFQVGAFVETKFVLNKVSTAVIVKNESILYENDKPYVFKLANDQSGTVQLAYVDLGLNEGSKTQIISGLTGEDSVVYEGQNNLKDNDIVEVFAR